jgi:aminoglycoside phosphotransferase (APT) family kinase protein
MMSDMDLDRSISEPPSDPPGIRVAAVTAWLQEHVGLHGPLVFSALGGGYSNLTYVVSDAGGRQVVLRRPPLGEILASAHDVAREHRVTAALHRAGLPVAEPLGLCREESVTGAPFLVSGFAEGITVQSPDKARRLSGEQRAGIGDSLPRTLAALHALDPASAGLEDFGRPAGYVERQLQRWFRQYEQSRVRRLPLLEEVHGELSRRLPPAAEAAVVHGDFRIDNAVLAADGEVVAVVDWELSTLGDPLADLGMTLAYWTEPDDDLDLPPAPTDVPGFGSRRDFAGAYAAAAGRPLANLDFYVAFAHWKIACISEGVYARFAAGALGQERDVDMALLERHPPARARAARRALDGELGLQLDFESISP